MFLSRVGESGGGSDGRGGSGAPPKMDGACCCGAPKNGRLPLRGRRARHEHDRERQSRGADSHANLLRMSR